MELFSINRRLGPLEIDLFATRFSIHLPRLVSWHPDPMTEADAFLQDWSAYRTYAHPPWWLISRVLFKVQAQEATMVIVVSLWQTQAWFPQLVHMLVEPPILQAGDSGAITELRLLAHGQNTSTNRVQGLRMRFKAEGISEEAIHLILASWRDKTTSNYNSSCKKWQSWCSATNTNPFAVDLREVLGFLAKQFEEGRERSSLNCYRSAISSAHLQIGYPVGKHPLVCRLLKGVFNLRPPLPRYEYTWDVKTVTSFIKGLGKMNR